jgi:hypothetical protein
MISESRTSTESPDLRRRLEEKYREERDKRLNPDGNRQYVSVDGAFADFAADPHADGSTGTRAPTWWTS